jgi:hypothetical protein
VPKQVPHPGQGGRLLRRQEFPSTELRSGETLATHCRDYLITKPLELLMTTAIIRVEQVSFSMSSPSHHIAYLHGSEPSADQLAKQLAAHFPRHVLRLAPRFQLLQRSDYLRFCMPALRSALEGSHRLLGIGRVPYSLTCLAHPKDRILFFQTVFRV